MHGEHKGEGVILKGVPSFGGLKSINPAV